MLTRFLTTGTLAGGLVLSVLNWVTAAILPPRFKQFRDPLLITRLDGLFPVFETVEAALGKAC